ncbi:hypothetical protein RHMOL_Rhmol11G0118800 [Rhododendron molle]|uniref:Uncharacterized protein n=1 Tax=Rhododendron molle TaxID=49168 RepID=A0ACC0LRA7_RHOML|nr:hypothetical protein RHMOL_Rhmol11G0118800 [Rhododendron molle]
MEAFLSYLLPIVILLASLFLISRAKNRYKGNSNLPPGTTGWPVVGESAKFALLGPEKYINGRMDACSPAVFQTSLLGEKMAVFCGPAGNKFLFSNENKLLTSWLPLSMRKALVFPSFVENTKENLAALKRSFMHEILKPEALKRYIPVMDSMAKSHIEEKWPPNREVKVFPLSKKYTFDLACHLFLNIDDPEHIKRLYDPFHLVISGLLSVPIDLPGTAYNRAIKGGKIIRNELLSIIRQREKELSENEDSTSKNDLLSRMLLAVDDENDKLMNEMDISNNIIGLLVASYDTTSSSLTMVLNYLAELPHIHEEVLREQMEIARSKKPGELLTWEDIEKMKYTWNVAREAMRLSPPAQGAFRAVATDFTYAGFTIPKGWKTFWTVYSTHKNPKYFPEPEKFDPSRFEGSGPAPYTYVPFGGGPRMCPGREYARLEILVFVHNVVTKFKMQKAIPNEKIVYHSSPFPTKGVPVCLQPHET